MFAKFTKKVVFLISLVLVLGMVEVWSFTTLAEFDPNLVSLWKFDEGSGTDAYDSAGTNHGTLIGDPNWVIGKMYDYALDFDGVDDYVDVPDDPSLRFNQFDSFSISFWAKPVSAGRVVCKMRASNCTAGIFGYETGWYESPPRFLFFVEKSCVGTASVETLSAPAGSWYHVVAVYDNKDMKIYLNGQLSNSGTFIYDTGGTTPDKNLAIGARSLDSIMEDYFDGTIDDVRIYDKALSAGEIVELYEAGLLRAFNPHPDAEETNVDANVVLSWSPGFYAADVNGHDVYFGTNQTDVNDANTSSSQYRGNQDSNMYDAGSLESLQFSQTYYWRIDEVNNAHPNSPWKGNVWSFTTEAPPEASNPNPADEATGVSIIADLSWTAGSGATSHDVYFGTSSPGVFQGNQPDTTFDPGTMADDTTYYWRIDEVGTGGTTTGIVWSFTTEVCGEPPGQASNPNPADEATGVSRTADLSWTAGSCATSHDVYFGTISPGVFQGNQSDTTFDPGTDANNTTYYWRIDEVGAGGTTTGVVWSFTTEAGYGPPGMANNPNPADKATGVSTTADLSWTAGLGATSHDVYFGTYSPGVFQGNQSGTTFDPGTMANNTTYYWRIDEIGPTCIYGSCMTYGVVWSFTTETGEEYISIDDFESYADGNGLRLNWIDGSDGNNSTGSLVSLETDTPHNGAKSMKYQYDNSTAPYYSEVYRIYITPQDWTMGGAKILSLFLHGVEDNITEKMYVVLADDNDANATVAYDNDANDIVQKEAEYWNIWNIMLQDFNDKGVDLTGIKKIVIGFGDRDNPQPGGLGTVYLDDIKLHTSRCAADYDYLPTSDFTRDSMVNVLDYAKLAYAWMTDSSESGFDELYDLDSNDIINADDLSIFTGDWLWPDKQVQITVDACDIKGEISTMLTGVNMNFDDDSDVIWADGSIAGYLIDVNAAILRYPGGAKTSSHHWEYPHVPKYTDAWAPDVDPNVYLSNTQHMDTDEYIAWCGVIGAEPLLGINIQSGKWWGRIADSIAEARRWVQYCKDNNYNVTYWYLDNEPFWAYIDVVEYANYIKQFVPEMRDVDPNIKIVINWTARMSEPSYWDDWEYLIEEAGQYIDIADVHWYWDNTQARWDNWIAENPMISRLWCDDCSGPDGRYHGPTYTEEIQQFYQRIQDVNGQSYDIKLVSLEWNIGKNWPEPIPLPFQCALMQAEMLGQFIEGGLHMACMWPLTWDWEGWRVDFRGIIDQTEHKPTPSFHVFKLYSNALGQQLITSQSNQPYIPKVSALSQDGNTLWVYLLNKSITGQAVRATIDISGFTPAGAEAISLTATDLSSDVGKLKKLKVQVNSQTGKWQSVLPGYSLTMLTFHK